MSVSRSRRSAGERSIARESKAAGQRIRKGLLCSTALVAASLAASGAMAQTASGGGAVTDQTGSNGGYLASGPTGVTVTNVTINNTTGSPTVDAIRFTSSTFAGSGRGFQFTGTNVLTAAPGGSAINYIGTGGENTGFGVAGSLTATGLNGWLAVNNGAIFHGGAGTINMIAQTNGSGAGLDWTSNNSCICDVSFSGSFSASNFQYGANLTAAAGVNFATGAGGSITGVQTGIRAITTTGNVDLSIGSSISASSTGISATSNGGAANVTATGAIVAPNGIVATGANGATVTTSGDGTIDSTAAGSGTGILATSSGGSNAVTVNVGAAIGGATAFARGVDVSTTGTSTGAINITTTAAIIAASRGISATAGTFGNTGTINVGGDVTGATGIYSNVGNYAVNVGAGVTVTSTGAGAANAALYLVNGTNTVTNNGALVASGTGSAGVYFSSNGLTTNTATGTITGSTGVYYQNSASLTNAGAITGTGVAASDAGVRSLGGTYNNTGTITGNTGMLNSGNLFTVNNTGAGATITGALNAINVSGGWLNLTNTGTIQTAGGTGGAGLAGVYINSAVTLYNQQITNSGSISGGSDATNGFGVNVVDGVLALTNQSGGTISGGTGGIRLASDDLATLNLNAGSTVTGGIVSTGTGARTTVLAGLVSGGYDASAGSGVDTFTLASTGSITGAVSLGGGNDTFIWQGGTFGGLIDGGTGTDTFNANLGAGGTGSLNVANIAGFETQNINSGAVTLTGARAGGQAWSVASGATAIVGGQLTGNTTSFTLSEDASLQLTSTGVLSRTSNTVQLTGAGTLDNSGVITGTSGSAVRVEAGGSITNRVGGQINAIGNNVAGIFTQGGATTVVNSGSITGAGTSVSAIWQNGGSLNLTNASGGIISSAESTAIRVTSLLETVITNSGTVTAAAGGYGFLTNGGDVTINNLAGGVFEATGTGGAILGNGVVGATLAVTNAGIIRSAGSNPTLGIWAGGGSFTNLAGGQLISTGSGAALSASSAGGGTIDLQAGSTVTGAITSSGSGAREVFVGGTLNGAYNAASGSGIDTITLASTGSMTSANLGSGDDTFTFQGGTFSGLIDGGSGTDSFISALGVGNSAAINQANLTNFESYTQQSGSLTLNGARTSGAAWTVAGGSLTLAGSLSGLNATHVNVTGAGAIFNNADGATVAGGNYMGVRVSGAGGTVNNLGSITNSGTGADGTIGAAVYVSTTTGVTTINNGSLTDTGAGSLIQGRNAGVRHQGGSDTLVVNNYGNIIGDLYNGIENSAGGLTVNNFADGLIRGAFTGISGSGVMNITNAGTISGVNGSSNGIASSGTLTLVNQNGGQITGGASGSAILSTGASALITNQSGGRINGFYGITTSGAGGVINNSGLIRGVNDAIILGGATALTNNAGGLIVGGGNEGVFVNATGSTINNAGLIVNSLSGVVANSFIGSIINSGIIANGTAVDGATSLAGITRGSNGAGIALGAGGHVTNLAGGQILGGFGILINNGATGSVTNSGVINANGAGQTAYAVSLTGADSTLSNLAGGSISSNNGDAVRSTGANAALTNAGSISGGAFGLNLSGGGTITNQSGGSITGTTGAINLTGASNYTLNLEAGSTTGEIFSTSSGVITTTVAGTLNGAYNAATGTGVHSVTLASTGSMTSANLGAGNDAFTWQGGVFSGLIDGGTGADSFISNLSGGTGSLNLANISAFESIIHQSGNVTLTGASASGAAEIHAGQGGPSGTLIFNGTSGLTGDIFVNGALLRAETAGAFGTGTIRLINPTVVYGATGTYANNILLEVQSPATADPSTLRTDAGVTATLSGSITQGTGAGVDPNQPLVIDDSGRIVLTNTANLWAGTTTINAGATLQGATDTISGSNTIANGVLHLLQPTSGAFAQNVSGGGNVQISGLNAGQTLTLSGALTNAFGVQVLDGSALAITGSVATTNGSSAVTLNSTNLAGVTNQLDNSGSISGVFAINAVRNLDLTNSGTISASITNFNNSGIYVGGTGTISNSGSITSGTNAIYTQGVGSVTNTGLIRGGGAASTIRLFGADSSVTNLAGGQITTTGTGVGVYLDGINASVINAGAISGGNAISLVSGGAIINTGTLTSTNGSGVVFQAAGSIDNQAFGSITGATNGVTYTAGSAAVTNAGSIAGSNGSGLRLLGGGTVTNAASGQITGTGNAAIFVQGGALNLVSQGSLVGTTGFAIVTTGAFNNVIDLQAGSSTNGSVTTDTGADALTVAGMLTGAVDLGAGNDTFTLVSGGSVTGLIDGGAGTDAFVLAGSGDAGFNVAQAVNFETRAMNGTGTWTLTGTDVSTAGWALNSGVLALSGGSAINDATGVTIAVAGTLALLTDEAIGSLAGSGFVNLGASRLTLAAAQTTAYAGVISGAGGLTVGSPNNLTLSGANTYTGTTIVDGVLTLGAAGVLADSSNLLINTAGTFDLQGFDETVNNAVINGVLNGTGTLTAAQYQLTGATVNANLGAGDLIQVSGVSALNGTSGAQLVSIAGGTLGLGASDRLSDTATVVVANGATLDLNAFNDTVGLLGLAGTLNGTGTLSASQYQLTGATANANLGAGDLIQISGLSTLNGTSGSQLVSIAGGTLGLGASDRLSDTATVVVANGATLDLNAFNDTVGLLGLAGTLNGTGTLTAGQYQLDGATVNANLGAGTLFNLGGVSTLNGTSGAGNIVVQAGTLALGASDRLSDTATLVVANGATLDLNAFNDTVNLALLNGTLAGTGTLTADQYQLTGATVNANLGAGTLFNLGGVSTLNGTAGAADVLLNAGTLRLGASGRLSDTATVSVATGATFALNGFDERIGALFGTGDVNVGAGRLTFGGIDSGFGGRLSGAGTLVHTGGLFTLMGDHTIASISNTGGELRFLGTTIGGIAVTGGSLTGAGTIGGALTASNGAILSPGVAGVQNGVGGFVAGGLTLNGATLAIDALGRSGGNLSDQLRINGTATLTGGLLAPTFQGGAADFDFSTRYLFLQANNLVGTFANGAGFTAADQEGLFWRVRYDLTANGAVLELRELTNFDPGATGTGNQRAVGRALSGGQLEASDDFAGILSLFASLNDADRAAAFESISGEPLAGMTTSLFGANGSFLTAMRDGGLSDRDGGGALGFVGRMTLSGGRETVADRVGAVMSAFDPSASTARGAGGWVAAYGADQTLEGKPGTADVDSRLNGFAGGYGVRNGAMGIGAAAGVTRLEGEVVDRQARYESDLTHAAAYAAFDDGVWAADVTVSIYGGGLDSRRGIQVGAFHGLAIGDTRAEGQSISASVARRFQLSQDTMIALGANGTASSASIDGFTEIGAGGLSLQASGLERDWQTLQISARGTQDYHVDGRRLRVYAGAGVMATTGDREATGDMRFSGAPTGFGAFTVEGAETPPVAGLADFGLEVGLREGLTLSAGYRGLYSERLRDNQVGIKLRANW